MKQAMEQMTNERKNELQGVLVKSSEVEVDRMLGKGGFGVVNLAKFRGGFVAMKQLLEITEESVKRFRYAPPPNSPPVSPPPLTPPSFECFLMKNLRHPNITKLEGVIWEEEMFGCLLEFVENGTLEDWLRKTTRSNRRLVTWKGKLLKVALETALGVRYGNRATTATTPTLANRPCHAQVPAQRALLERGR
jgi:serine/threonine protein kinase